ncbi:serine/threonine protein kinase [Leucobacter exalbidus]|uniref:non-specific serine/threonine protein kinase n=1 Tax=Leucobacter exalbidus TaxID=662960 RepID=A0A940PVT9_9MICO|nr:serine/threonine protein kinase [Leucobacter exalbidus]
MHSSKAQTPPHISGFNYVRPLGSGGFARVYQYEQDMPRRVVAVKVLKDDVADENGRAAFEAEADAMARLSSHPSIVSIYTASVSSDGHPFIAMEYCPESFRTGSKGAVVPLADVLDAGVRLAGALETAHQSGVLHRDIKPSNVLRATTDRPLLADFGIVSLRGQMRGEYTDRAMSLPWAAPEVVTGSTSGTVASEVWALGATLYTFAAGQPPFGRATKKGTDRELIGRIERAKYVPVPGAQGYEAFDSVMARALAKDPAQRFTSMHELGITMQQLQRHYGLDVTPLDVVKSTWVTPAVTMQGVRGPQVSTVQQGGRAAKRAALANDASRRTRTRVGTTSSGNSALKPALIGAGAAAVVLAAGAGIMAMMGAL